MHTRQTQMMHDEKTAAEAEAETAGDVPPREKFNKKKKRKNEKQKEKQKRKANALKMV